MNLMIKENKVVSEKKLFIPVQQMTRTSGYYANVSNMNKGKREEVSERKYLNIETALNKQIGDYNACTSSQTGLQQ